MKKYKKLYISIGLYLASTAVSFGIFNFLLTKPSSIKAPTSISAEEGLAIDPSAPKTEVCPITGKKYTEIEREAWEPRRPLTVMVENHLDSRPQSGLSRSDVVYETIAEGGITRFLVIFYCDVIARDTSIAPIRSARTYFLDWASEYGELPLYVHVGGANLPGPSDALGQIRKYGWSGRFGNDMNQFSIGYPTFYRDYNRLDHDVATEHTMVSSSEKLWKVAEKRGWTSESPDGDDWTDSFVEWEFKDDADEADRGSTTSIAHDFWDGFKQYDVKWAYDQAANSYLRANGGQDQIDLNNNERVSAKNVVILFTKEKGPIDELKHMLYTTIGKGNALIFQDGNVIEATWSKPKRTSRTVFADKKGKDIEFVRGRVWISVVANGTQINY